MSYLTVRASFILELFEIDTVENVSSPSDPNPWKH